MKTTNCKDCGKVMPIRNATAQALIKKHGKPLCTECRGKVAKK